MHAAGNELGQAKIGDLNAQGRFAGPFWLGKPLDEDVVWLDVAVDDAAFMGIAQGIGGLGDEEEGLAELDDLFALDELLDVGAHAHARHILHHNVKQALLAVEVVDGDNRRVVEPGGGLGFLHEALLELWLVGELPVHDFEGHRPGQGQVGGAVDRPHAALA